MCFGDSEKTSTTTTTKDPALEGASRSNIQSVMDLMNKGFQPYGGPEVANFSPQQSSSFNMVNSISQDPQYLQRAQDLVNQYSSNPAGNIQTRTLAQGVGQYMDPQSVWAQGVLEPQLQDLESQRDAAVRNSKAGATMAGAFGDPRAAIDENLVNSRYDTQRRGLVGNAYQQAYQTALGAAAQDASMGLQSDVARTNANEAANNRMLQGAAGLEGLQNQQIGVAGAQNQMGAQQTAAQQAQINAQKNNWLMQLLYPQQIAALMNQTIGAANNGLGSTSKTVSTEPDNSGMGLLGALGGGFMKGAGGEMLADGLMMFSDVRLKDDVHPIGKLHDGTNVYEFKYKGDPRPRMGVMAQEVEKTNPSAVTEIAGYKAVDYGKVAARAHLARALGLDYAEAA